MTRTRAPVAVKSATTRWCCIACASRPPHGRAGGADFPVWSPGGNNCNLQIAVDRSHTTAVDNGGGSSSAPSVGSKLGEYELLHDLGPGELGPTFLARGKAGGSVPRI